MTDPTDKELQALWSDAVLPDTVTKRLAFSFARAVLAKWGTLRADGIVIPTDTMEQEFQKHYRRGYEAGKKATTSQPTQAQVVNQANRPFIVRLAEDFAEKCVTAGYVTTKAASYGRLMDEALSTKAQAGAVPLTKEQAASLCKMGPVYAPDGQVVRTPEQYRRELEGAKLAGIRTAERAHGITGGQHGAE